MAIEQNSEMPMPHKPGVLMIHLLDQCNLLCKYCYMSAAPTREAILPLKLVTRSIKEAKKIGIKGIWLSGGEPFLYPELSEVINSAAKQNALKINISTNGTLIGKNEATLLKATNVNVGVSIDGPEMYQDKISGVVGAFKQASRGIEHLTSAGVLTGIVSVICKDNLAMLPWLVEWAADMGVKSLTAQPLLQFGRGLDIKDKKLSQEQLCDLAIQLSDLAQTSEPQGLRLAMAYRPTRFLAEHPCAAYVCNGEHCHRGVKKEIKKIVIREDGTVLPETPTLDRRFALGSLHESTLEDLVIHYLDNGYAQFDRLCRTVYEEVMPAWTAPLIPWAEILSERSWTFDTKPTLSKAARSTQNPT